MADPLELATPLALAAGAGVVAPAALVRMWAILTRVETVAPV
jgi:hypothetical protein